MSFVRDLSDQSRQVFLAMPMQSRIIAILLVVAIAVSFGFLVRGESKADMVYLLGDQVLSESEMVAMDIAFGNANLKGWDRAGRRIQVPRESRSEFLAALKDSTTLPSGLQNHVEKALSSMSPFESSAIQKERLRVGKQQDVAKSLESYADIRTAVVHYTISEQRRPFQPHEQSAAVLITPEGMDPLPRARTKAIQEYVAKSFGMSIENVNVTDINASGKSALADDEDPLLRRQREVEERKRLQILNALTDIEGVRVEVKAEIDPILGTEEVTHAYEAQPTTLQSTTRKISQQSTRPQPQGVPGAVPNAVGNRAASLDENAQTSTLTDDTKETNAVTGQKYSRSQKAGLVVNKITATIVLPTSYYDRVWMYEQQRQNVAEADLKPLDPTELERLRTKTTDTIRELVTPLLSEVAAGADARPDVIVKDLPDLRQPEVVESKTAERALAWLASSWQTIAMMMLGLFALLVARGAIRGGTGDGVPPSFQEGFGLELPAPPPELDEEEGEAESMTITGGSLKEELVTLVESNPEVAANVIRNWVGEAA